MSENEGSVSDGQPSPEEIRRLWQEHYGDMVPEKIIDTKVGPDGKRYYKVQWAASTMEPGKNFLQAELLIKKYWDPVEKKLKFPGVREPTAVERNQGSSSSQQTDNDASSSASQQDDFNAGSSSTFPKEEKERNESTEKNPVLTENETGSVKSDLNNVEASESTLNSEIEEGEQGEDQSWKRKRSHSSSADQGNNEIADSEEAAAETAAVVGKKAKKE